MVDVMVLSGGALREVDMIKIRVYLSDART